MVPFSVFYWDPNPELFILPIVHLPILWYGLLFAFGFAVGFPIFVGILTRFLGKGERKKAVMITDRLTLYMVLATVIGARLGHVIFYEHPSTYLTHPEQIFQTWRGGLASHGAAVAIIIALILFSRRMASIAPGLTWIRLLDFISVPTAFAACCIRIGNFINQEILGTPTNVPWAVIFGHPADHSIPIPRHPVQLYEALFYLAVFFLLWRLSFKKSILLAHGKMIGIFLILVFGFRFFIEFFKTEQSQLLSHSPLSMGQILSIPIFLAGIYFFTRK